jgi:hypothetical protein
MYREPLRFKKPGRSGGQSNCVEIAHTLRHIRDSKNAEGSLLEGIDVRRFIMSVK